MPARPRRDLVLGARPGLSGPGDQRGFRITAELGRRSLTDTPPPAVASFAYDLETDSKGRPVVELSWVPGDDKKVRYELYRDGELILETDADNPITEYRDTDVDEGDTYEYTLRVFHYRAEGPSASLKVRITPPSIEIPNVMVCHRYAEDAIEDAGFVFGGRRAENIAIRFLQRSLRQFLL